MEDKLCEINRHVELGDPQSIYRTAHAIKSMSANIGAEKVRAISSQIELAGKANNLGDLDEQVKNLDQGYSEFKNAFKVKFID
jgi:HPt (histidine-containing phosphotransfer) domain-containing protein